MSASICSVSSATLSPSLKTLEPFAYTRDAYRAAFENAQVVPGVGLGFMYNSHQMGTLAPPPTPRVASSETLPDAFVGQTVPVSVEEQVSLLKTRYVSVLTLSQVLKAMQTNKLFIRSRQTRNSKTTSPFLPSPYSPLGRPQHPLSVHSSPMMGGNIGFTSSTESTRKNEFDVESVGLGISGLNIMSSSTREEKDVDTEILFEDEEWEYVKPAGFKSCKGRVCTPHLALERNNSWL